MAMAIDTERATRAEDEPEATADGGLCRLDPPGTEPDDEELAAEQGDGT